MKVFVGFFLLFFVVVGAFVALFLYQGQAVQRYGRDVLSAVGQPPAGPLPCNQAAPALKVPSEVVGCEVRAAGGRTEVELRLNGGRSFRLTR